MNTNNIDPMYTYINNDVILLNEHNLDIYSSDTLIHNKYEKNESLFNPINYNDEKIQLLLDVLIYCNTLSQNNILIKYIDYIQKHQLTYEKLIKHTIKLDIITALESVNISKEDPMFMGYYRTIRSLKN